MAHQCHSTYDCSEAHKQGAAVAMYHTTIDSVRGMGMDETSSGARAVCIEGTEELLCGCVLGGNPSTELRGMFSAT